MRRSWISACALLLAVPLQAAGQRDSQRFASDPPAFLDAARKRGKWDEPAEPVKIAGPIYFVGTKGLSVFLITTAEGHILINTGMPGSGPMIEASVRKLGFRPEEIRILLAGHAHVDHVGGHAYLKKLAGAKIAMIAEEKALFESGGKLDFHYGSYREFHYEPAAVDRVFRDGDTITLGDAAITALLTSGHTRGSTTFVMKIADGGRTYSVVFPTGASINPGYRIARNPSYPGIGDDLRRSVRVLEGLTPDIWLTAHTDGFEQKRARAMRDGAKAWVDPRGYRQWIAAQHANLKAALERDP